MNADSWPCQALTLLERKRSGWREDACGISRAGRALDLDQQSLRPGRSVHDSDSHRARNMPGRPLPGPLPSRFRMMRRFPPNISHPPASLSCLFFASKRPRQPHRAVRFLPRRTIPLRGGSGRDSSRADFFLNKINPTYDPLPAEWDALFLRAGFFERDSNPQPIRRRKRMLARSNAVPFRARARLSSACERAPGSLETPGFLWIRALYRSLPGHPRSGARGSDPLRAGDGTGGEEGLLPARAAPLGTLLG